MIRDVVEYYKQVTINYNDMRSELSEMEELLKENEVTPEMVENMKQMVLPIKMNYEALSYFMFLLNKPAKKNKQEKYANQNKRLIKESGNHTKEDIINENENSLSSLRSMKGEIQNDWERST